MTKRKLWVIPIIVLVILIVVFVFNQKNKSNKSTSLNYQTISNINYYSETSKIDDYKIQTCMLDIYYPTNKKNFATIIWLHGGGLYSGIKELPDELKNNGLCVVGVGYRLYPNVKSPEYIKDVAAAVNWTFKNIKKYGGDTSLIFISGHSAGAYLACMLGFDKKWLNKYNIETKAIAGLIPLSPQTITHFTIRKERGIRDTQPIVDSLAPLYYVNNQDSPKTLLITGDRDLELLGRYEENAYFLRMLKVTGHTNVELIELKKVGHNMTTQGFPYLLNFVNGTIIEKDFETKKNNME